MVRRVLRYRMKDVGRPGHHYLEIKVLKGEGPRGGRTEAKLITHADLSKRIKHMVSVRKRKR